MAPASQDAPTSSPRGAEQGEHEPRAHDKPSSMRSIFVMIALAITIFMGFTVYSVHKEIQGSAQLQAIKNMYFPLLQRLDANIVRLDKIQEYYIQVVITGDRDTINKAAELGNQADQAFWQISDMYPGHEQDIDRLRSDLRQYQDLATKTSLAFLNRDRAAAAPMAAAMNRALADVEQRLKSFRKSSYEGFVQTLAGSQRDAEVRLAMGLAMGAMNLAFMAVLVYFIAKNVKMMTVIAVQNKKLAQDNANLRALKREVQKSEKLLDAVITDVPIAIQACDVTGRIILQNRAAMLLFTRAIAPQTDRDAAAETAGGGIFLPDGATPVPIEEQPLARALRGETVTDMELLIPGAGDVVRTTLASARRLVSQDGECIGATAVAQDITDQRRLERNLAQAQKLESIGQLSAGIAHEINTPTQFIGDNVRFLRDSFAELFDFVDQLGVLNADGTNIVDHTATIAAALALPDVMFLRDEIPKAISQCLEGIARIASIVGAMKEFSHPGIERTPLDLNRAIASTITVASSEWKYVADMATEFDPSLPFVPVMPGPFNQVVLNMIVNAAHAIGGAIAKGSQAKGTITITTRLNGAWAEIVIKDTGCGMPASVVARIFDPFFTTKPVGKGTGQGLAIAHDVIVQKHGGTISVSSEPGRGTAFTLRLPIVAASAAAVQAVEAA